MMAKNKTVANLVKKMIRQNSITIAPANVVTAAARMLGPMLIKACLVRRSFDTLPGNEQKVADKCTTKSQDIPIKMAKQIDSTLKVKHERRIW